MTVRFGNNRLLGYVLVWGLSATVLGLSAYFASIFLPNIHHDFLIFSIVVSSLTIFVFLLSVNWAQPWTEAVSFVILGILWLAMGAWSTDMIGHIECFPLGGQRTATRNGSISAKQHCYEMKVIQAFSWMLFGIFMIFLCVLVTLTSRAASLGRPNIWNEPIQEVGWFNEYPGYPGYGHYMGAGQGGQYPGGQMAQFYGTYRPGMTAQGQYYVPQQPGTSLVIQPGMNGAPPTVTHVPGNV